MEQYYERLIGYLVLKLRDQEQAKDIAHEAYAKVLENTKGKVVLEYPQAYLFRTALNLVTDLYRENAKRPTKSLDDDSIAVEQSTFRTPAKHLYEQERAMMVERALGELQDNCRRAFLLRKLEGLNHDQIALQMNISKAMVEKHIVNAMKHCRIRVREMEYSRADDDAPLRRFSRRSS
ncbi:sigma-70 family RNA polymerase sigma factor [Pseudomonas sp. ABC1]|uniref:sigma-70 family RNA polymerase sigma factor n=1 Tax=Pseudomonas sp. ABC1 TaxID=2748080 RepID=UPI0015C30513|nr:sigma-70 family RNA polymerase sigma factor [Pseudomonas sp. ABC1]QLF94941.1 sigma-70 family RNA polymerase sigma factor [Pseudomonas sp. ABC1]